MEVMRRRALAFLRSHLPESDLDCCPASLFERFADHALALREEAPWCAALDWEIFAHYVLFPRVNDEDLSFHREIFHDALWPRVKDLPSMEDRVLEVNRWCHEHASYQAQDERTASPLTVYRCGSGRCGEESAFLVSALRSVGIPARQVYAPRWSHCDDNHAWVEALCGDTWRFLGACEPEPVLDRGWFLTAASRAMLVHSRVFGAWSSPLHGEPLGREGAVTWFNQTARYAAVYPYTFRSLLPDGAPAAGAQFQLQVLNEASFHTIAALTAGADGTARAALGRGSLHVSAALGDLSAEGECGEEGIVLSLAPPEAAETPWVEFDFRAPAGLASPPETLTARQKAEREETLRRGNALREQRLFTEESDALLRAARGNRDTIRAFLDGPDPDLRRQLVRTLADKDLRDVTGEVLEDHFAHLPPRREAVPEDIYWRYAACPRIALEKLTPWRGALSERFSSGEAEDPAALWEHLEALLPDPGENEYGSLYRTPAEALAAGRCDEKSRRVLLIAILRTRGAPARLREGAPEVWREGAFHPVRPEAEGVLRLTGELRYKQEWSLARRTREGWRTLALTDGNPAALRLPAGQYRITSALRLPGGDQLAARRELELPPGGERTCRLYLRPRRPEDLLCRQSLPALPARTLAGEEIADVFRQGGGPLLALWLEEGREPTEHLLNELMERREVPGRLCFLLRSRDGLNQPTLARALSRLPQAEVLLDDWAYDLEVVARRLGRDPDSPPLAVLCDGAGQALYSDCGYRVGAVDLLLQAAALAKTSQTPSC